MRNKIFLVISLLLLVLIHQKMGSLMPSNEVLDFEFIRTEKAVLKRTTSFEWMQIDSNGRNKSDKLRTHTFYDFGFVVAYVAFLYFLMQIVLGNSFKYYNLMLNMLITAGFCDIIENIYLIKILNGARSLFPLLMFGFASIKFLLLAAFVLLFLVLWFKKMRKTG